MKIVFGRTRDEISAERQLRYLTAWPITKQMEAHAEAAQGRPEKLEQMLSDFDQIKASLPYKDP